MRELPSKSQIERLGNRLVRRATPEDLRSLHEMLATYADVLEEAVAVVRSEVGVAPTARVKNTGTILEKLDRYGGSWLKSIHDLAGMRVVEDFTRSDQDELVARIVEAFAASSRAPRIIDRRAAPVRGYRAVHVVVFPRGIPVEIQIRTRLQHEWAELFEKLADRIGRGIRYGEPPDHWLTPEQRSRLAPQRAEEYALSYEMLEAVVHLALANAALIDAVEVAEQKAPGKGEIEPYRERVMTSLTNLRIAINEFFGAE